MICRHTFILLHGSGSNDLILIWFLMLSYCSVHFDFLWFTTENVCHKAGVLLAAEILLFITCILHVFYSICFGGKKPERVNTRFKFLSDNLKIEQQYLTFISDFSWLYIEKGDVKYRLTLTFVLGQSISDKVRRVTSRSKGKSY